MASGSSSYSRRTRRYNYAVEQEAMDRTPVVGRTGRRTQERPPEPENRVLQQLIPGLPDQITLNHITAQLPWTDSHTLPLLGRAWNRVIQSREVHCARVQSHSTETLVVVTGAEFIALYSMRSKKFYSLPPIPGVDPCILSGCQCVSLDGRVYILSGLDKKRTNPPRFVPGSVYVLELVGLRKWQKCANMPHPRHGLVCGIMDEKIFVFGGFDDQFQTVCEQLVYDPKVNVWSAVMAMPSLYCANGVAAVGNRVAKVGGVLLRNNETDTSGWEGVFLRYTRVSECYSEYVDLPDNKLVETLVLQVYNPVRNDWGTVETAPRLRDIAERRLVFLADGKVYVMTESAIHRHDTEKNTWTEVHTFSCAVVFEFIGQEVFLERLRSLLAVNGELLAIFSFWTGRMKARHSYLFQSKGFGGASKVIVWEKVTCSEAFGSFPCMCPVEL